MTINASLPADRMRSSPIQLLTQSWDLIKDQYGLFIVIALLATIISSAVPLLLIGPAYCGLYLSYLHKKRGQSINIDKFFEGFNFFVDGLLLTLLQMAFLFVFVVPIIALALVLPLALLIPRFVAYDAGALLTTTDIPLLMGTGLIMAMGLIIGLLIPFFTNLSFPLLVDKKLKPWPTFVVGLKASWQHRRTVIGLALCNLFLGLIGVCLCYVGVFLVLPITTGAWVLFYEEILGMGSSQE